MTPVRISTATTLHTQGGSQNSSSTTLENIKTIVEVVGTSATAIAIIIGGLWAYSKFVRGRTFRPRLLLNTTGQWRNVEGKAIFQAEILLKNIGASKVPLTQTGTGFRACRMRAQQPSPPSRIEWDKIKTFAIFESHDWIEPGETIADRPLMDLGVDEPTPLLIETRLIVKRSLARRNIEFTDTRFVPVATETTPAPGAVSPVEESQQGSRP